jgi:hypothetical protein
MATLRKALVLLVLALGLAYFLWRQGSDASTGLTLWDPEGPPPPRGFVELGAESEPAPGAAATLPGDAEVRLPPATIRGRVVGADGAPLPGLDVLQKHPYLAAGPVASGVDGSFELRVDEPRGELILFSSGWMLLGGVRQLAEGTTDGYVLVAAPGTTISGTVADDAGRPLPDVSLRVLPPGDLLVPFGTVSPPIVHESQSGWSDEKGRFHVGPVPRVPGLRIEASYAGYLPATVEVPEDYAQPVAVVLAKRE